MKIALCGYKGKMGGAVYELLIKEKYYVIGIDIDTISLKSIIDKVDLVLDFTNKKAALENIYTCLDHKKNFISGTTGFSSIELAKIKSLCKKENVKGIICYNFSLPLNYLLQEIKKYSTYFNDIQYLDVHHVSKLDKISGTTYLFLMENDKIQIKSYKSLKNNIIYIIKMYTKYDKMIISYEVNDRLAFALGVLEVIKDKSEKKEIKNLIG